jgi:hypothetical protein
MERAHFVTSPILKKYERQPAKYQKVIEVYELLLVAATRRQPVAAIYDGLPRLLCPHVLGRKQSQLHALVYQVGGGSHSGLPVTPARAGVWRACGGETQSGRTPCRRMELGATLVPANLH